MATPNGGIWEELKRESTDGTVRGRTKKPYVAKNKGQSRTVLAPFYTSLKAATDDLGEPEVLHLFNARGLAQSYHPIVIRAMKEGWPDEQLETVLDEWRPTFTQKRTSKVKKLEQQIARLREQIAQMGGDVR